jgi:adenine-specific DNA-methyltransferase
VKEILKSCKHCSQLHNEDELSEKYEFTWPDKQNAKKRRVCTNKNLEVLKILQKSYYDKVKMIYIDPPYNTGNNFIYPDNFTDSIKNYKKITGQTLKSNPETNGRFHSKWLNMMYPPNKK